MFVRLKKNISGSTTVMLNRSERRPGKKNPTTVLVKNFGTSCNPKQIKKWEQEAQQYMKTLGSFNKKGISLKITSPKDLQQCQITCRGFHGVYQKLYKQVFKGFSLKGPATNQLLQDVTILRIANPSSKYKSAQISAHYGCPFKVDSVYKMMDLLDSDRIAHIKSKVYHYTCHLLKQAQQPLEVLFYDLTTIYFETNSKDDLRQFGFSKDGKSQHVQISLALIVTQAGLPIGYELFPGNIYEGHTLKSALAQLKSHYSIEHVTIVADSGLMNQKNLKIIEDSGCNYIIAARIKSMKKSLADPLLDPEGYHWPNDSIGYKVIPYDKGKNLIACFSPKKKAKDEKEREKKIRSLLRIQGKSIKNALAGQYKQPYVKIDHQATLILDMEQLNKTKRYDGYFGMITNCKTLSPLQAVMHYKGLWQIEQSFKIMKSDLSIRPVFHWSIPRMQAHFAICFMAFSLLRFLEYQLKKKGIALSPKKVHTALSSVNTVLVKSRDQAFHLLQDIPEDAKTIYKAIKAPLPKTFLAE